MPESVWDYVAVAAIDSGKKTAGRLNLFASRALLLRPNSVELHAVLGLKAINFGDYHLAQEWLSRAVVIDPSRRGCNLDLGLTYENTNDVTHALRFYLRESILSPLDPVPHFNSANAAMAQGKPTQSARSYQRAIDLGMLSTGLLKSAAIAHLMSGNFGRGWALYESRFLSQDLKTADKNRTLPSSKPRVSGSLAAYKTASVLVWAEQGVGDEIMFGSMLAEFHQHVGRLLVQLDRRLIPIFERSLPSDITFLERGTLVAEEMYDAHIAIGSLGQYLRPSIHSFIKKRRRYLRADPQQIQQFGEWLNIKEGQTAIGLSWRSTNVDIGSAKSVPLSALVQAMNAPGVKFVNLQYGAVNEELELIRETLGIEIVTPPNIQLTNDLDGLAALIEACDKVVSIGNATAHLSGALGKRTIALVPRIGTRTTSGGVMPGWRWLEDSGTCLWYESVELLRQNENEIDWNGALLRLKNHTSQRQK